MKHVARCPCCEINNEIPEILNPYISYCCYCGKKLDVKEVARRVKERAQVSTIDEFEKHYFPARYLKDCKEYPIKMRVNKEEAGFIEQLRNSGRYIEK